MIRLSSLSSTRSTVWPMRAEGSTILWRGGSVSGDAITGKASAQRPVQPTKRSDVVAAARSPFERFNLPEPSAVPLRSREARAEEVPKQLGRQLLSNHPGTEAEHVHVVVLDPLARRE